MKTAAAVVALAALNWAGLWFTPDQQGRRFFERGEFSAAAQVFRDPLWQGTAWFRAGEFKKAEQAFARLGTAEAHFNRGNALVMQGKYEAAIGRYDRALELRPAWADATANRDLAKARAALMKTKGGDETNGEVKPDDFVFDNKAKNSQQTTQVEGEQPMSNAAIQAQWLRRVQTKPADFLRAKFSYQQAQREKGGTP